MPVVEVRLFGAPRVNIDGTASSFNRKRALALLAYLATSETPTARDTILGLLWPDFAQADAKNGLRRELSLLRQLLGNGIIAADRSSVSLARNSDSVWIDIVEFKRLTTQVSEHEETDDQLCGTCVGNLQAAADLYATGFLNGFALPDSPAFDEWQFLVTEQFRSSYDSVLQKLGEWHQSRADYDQALAFGRRRLTLDPTNESSGRDLMKLLAWSGQTSAALREYELLVQRLRTELDVRPEPETDELAELIRKRELTMPNLSPVASPAAEDVQERKTPPHNLPSDTTPFVGREKELAEIEELIASPDVRLITITGPGGMGKTRLAVAAAARQLISKADHEQQFSNGIYVASLAPLSHSDEIVTTLGRMLGYTFDGQQDRELQLITFLKPKKLLLVLDNYEHLLDSNSAGLPARILEGAADVKIIVTSRSRLSSRSEHIFILSGFDTLELPLIVETAEHSVGQDLDTLKNNPAITLFINAAQRVQPDFQVTTENVLNVAKITHLVGGMPLGIELAAGWLELFAPSEIVAEIEASLDFLSSEMADIPARQSSLRSVFETSWRLLPEHEQRAIAALSIFRGGFERHAAEAVVEARPKMLLALVNKSWLQPVHDQRFQIHEMLRQFAEDQLKIAPDDYFTAREQHCDYYASYVAKLDLQLKGPNPAPAVTAFRVDQENIVRAWRWLVEHDRTDEAVDRMLPGIFRYAEARFEKPVIDTVTELGIRALEQSENSSRNSDSTRYALRIAQFEFWDDGWPIRFAGYQYTTPGYRKRLSDLWQLHNSGPVAHLWTSLGASHVGMQVDYELGLNYLQPLVDSPPPDYDEWDLI